MIRVVSSRMRRSLLISLLLLALGAVPAHAAERKLWATVNVCDTAAHPDEIGIRAALPAARRPRAGVRFRVQYRDAADGRWRWVQAADSGWHTGARARESGWSFEVAGERDADPARRRELPLEARRASVVRRARRVTEVGHRSTAGADPADFSAATCRITLTNSRGSLVMTASTPIASSRRISSASSIVHT